jgi:hypothetical protein
MSAVDRCADCGTALGELCRDHTGDLICRRCYQRRPDIYALPDPKPEAAPEPRLRVVPGGRS